MAVSGGRNRDARHEVEVAVAVHVLDHHAFAAGDDERVLLEVGVRRKGPVAINNGLREGAWKGGLDAWVRAYRRSGRWLLIAACWSWYLLLVWVLALGLGLGLGLGPA